MSFNENPPEWTPPAPAASTNLPYSAPPYSAPPYSAPPHSAQPYSAPPAPPFQYAPGFFPPPTPPTPPRRRRRKLIGAVVLVLLLVGGGLAGYQVLHHNAPPLNYQGQSISQPMAALTQAEAKVFTLSQKQPTSTGPGNHCYYGVPANAKGKQSWEVSAGIFCGPMAFLDSTDHESFLHYSVQHTASGKGVSLTPSDNPESLATAALPAGVVLVRPGSAHRTRSFDRLPPPIAPPGSPNVFVSVTDVGPGHDLRKHDGSAELDGSAGNVVLTSLSTVPYYDTGNQARSAAAGQKLIAFGLSYDGATGTTIKNMTVGVSVAGGALQALPHPESLDGYKKVISVPTSVSSVDLVLENSGLRQTISLLDGHVGAGNIALTARPTQYAFTPVTHDLTLRFSAPNGYREETGMHIDVSQVRLSYFENINNQLSTPKNPKLAFLHVDMTFTLDGTPGQTYGGIESPVIELKDSSGKVYQSTNIDSAQDQVYFVYTVPADFTSGSIDFGDAPKQFDDGTSESITTPFQFPFSIPTN